MDMEKVSDSTARGPVAIQQPLLVDFLVDDVAAAEVVEADIKADVRRCAPMANAATKKLLEQNKALGAQEMIRYANILNSAGKDPQQGTSNLPVRIVDTNGGN